jgi:hypothetical protein
MSLTDYELFTALVLAHDDDEQLEHRARMGTSDRTSKNTDATWRIPIGDRMIVYLLRLPWWKSRPARSGAVLTNFSVSLAPPQTSSSPSFNHGNFAPHLQVNQLNPSSRPGNDDLCPGTLARHMTL